MKSITILAAAGVLVATPAIGAWAAFASTDENPSPETSNVPVDDRGRNGDAEPGDDHGRDHRHRGADDRVAHQRHGADDGVGHVRHDADDGAHHARHDADDPVGHVRHSGEAEPGDDHGGHGEAEPGDDHGGDD